MNDSIMIIQNNSNTSWDDDNNGPSLHTRIVFASAWILIAVAGIVGKKISLLLISFKCFFSRQ